MIIKKFAKDPDEQFKLERLKFKGRQKSRVNAQAKKRAILLNAGEGNKTLK